MSGLPKKTKAKIRVAGLSGVKSVTKSRTVKKLKPGSYSITVSDVRKGKYWYRGVSQSTTKQVLKGKTVKVRIRYQKATTPTPTPPPPTPTSPTTPLRFNFTGAVGVAITAWGASGASDRSGRAVSPASAGTSGLLAVHADGSTTSAITSGDSVQTPTRIYRGPDGAVVLQYSGPVSPETGHPDTLGCALIRVPPNSDRGACVDPWLIDVPSMPAQYFTNPRVQFDAAGAVYYVGLIQMDRNPLHQATTQVVFRRSGGGVVTDIAPGLVSPTFAGNGFLTRANFAVSGDGTVYFSGAGTDPYGSVYRTLPDGTTSLVLSGQNIGFLSVLADNNLYFGTNQGVYRFDASTGKLDARRWLATYRSWDGLPEVAHDCTELAVAFTGDSQASCPSITSPKVIVSTADGHAVGDITLDASGGNWPTSSSGLLVRYLPDPVFLKSSVRIESAAVAAGNTVILAGTDASGTPRLVSLDDTTGKERALFDADTQVDIYHLVYSGSRNLVMFDGLRFSDNNYVIGSVDLSSGDVQMAPAAKLSDFQAL